MDLRTRRYVRINAQGKKLSKFINLLRDNGIGCRRQYCCGDMFHGDILRRDLEKMRIIADKNDITLKTAEYDSVSARIYRYRRRIGLLIGAVIAVAAAFYFSQVVVTIEINGNASVSDEIILSALAEMDIKAGTPIRRLDLRSCEQRLRLMIDEVAWAGIRHTGSRIVVQIREVTPIPDMVHDRTPCNIIADRDAIISSVRAEKGRTVHTVGDKVTKGTVLISGISETADGETPVCHAMGEIRGIYDETVRFSGAFSSEDILPTGKQYKKRSLELFSLDIPLTFGSEDFRRSTSSLSQHRLKLFGKELPIGIRCKTIRETELSKHTLSEDELSDKLMERVYLYEMNFLSDADIIDRKIEKEISPDTLTLCVTYRLDGIISEQRDLLIK
ncbi:MAG: sporulation protein YqfD [Ruminococcus sp.]|nr:sporulation protein YqfD [Ruminococcus sp.]